MRKIVIAIMLLVLVSTSIACASHATTRDESSSSGKYTNQSSGGTANPAPQITTGATPPDIKLDIPPAEVSTSYSSADTSTQSTDRMIIRTGNMDIVVEDVQSAIQNIASLAESMQGFVVQSTTWRSGNSLFGTIGIRVPAESFNSVISTIHDSAIEVNSENTSASDVTEEYIDLQAKLSNLEAAEKQLLVILEKATTVEDILKVQNQLTATRGEIEQTKGSIQYIERTTAMSYLEIKLSQSKLYAEITVDRAVVNAGENVYFRAEVSGGFSPFSYEWKFGDGSSSTNPNPAHSYKSAGDYTIELTVTDDKGNTVTATREKYINVLTGWSAGNTVQSAWNGLKTFGRALANIFIWVGILSPIWIIGGGIGFFFWRRSKKRKTA
jgi:hypothetical protein